jgi:hypothetical protein
MHPVALVSIFRMRDAVDEAAVIPVREIAV